MGTEKKLRRSRDKKMIAGVCGGLAEYFGLDATIIRIAVAFLTIFTAFAGCLVYIILWLIIPQKDIFTD